MTSKLKSLIRRGFYQIAPFRLLVGWVSIATGRTQSLGISHLMSYCETSAVGPLQRDEAVALFGITRVLRPKTVVEFGFFHGHSAYNFLCALDADANLFSYDVSDESATRARKELKFDSRLTFLHKSQTAFDAKDLDSRPIDLVFFDAAHDLELNKQTFQKIVPHLAPFAIIAIHDTGLWSKAHFSPIHETFADAAPKGWLTNELYAHQPDERKYVDWITSNYPEFTAVHLHSTNTLRHGITLVQRKSAYFKTAQ